jgi:hypothetical protein
MTETKGSIIKFCAFLLSNLFVIYLAITEKWFIGDVLWVYTLETIVVLAVSIIRIFSCKITSEDIKAYNENYGKRKKCVYPENTSKFRSSYFKVNILPFFFVFFSLFLIVYLRYQIRFEVILLPTLTLFANSLLSAIINYNSKFLLDKRWFLSEGSEVGFKGFIFIGLVCGLIFFLKDNQMVLPFLIMKTLVESAPQFYPIYRTL